MNPLLARFDGEEALVAPEFQARFEACLAAVAAHERRDEILGVTAATAAAEDGFWGEPGSFKAALRPYVVRDGVLQIPVKGVLLNDFPYAFGSYATGYAYIRRALDRGLTDAAVKGIAFVCDSPGGMVAGNFDLADRIFAARETKPLRAFAHEGAYSAAYSLASAAGPVIVSRSGGVGSIGVLTMHRDVSKALAEAGIKITLIFAGEHKVDGNAFEPLPAAVRDRLKARVEATYAEFVAIVARNRSMSTEAVRATQALTYPAREAISVGLADAIGTLDDAVAEFAASLNPETDDEDTMSTIDQAAHDAAVTGARTEGHSTGRSEGEKAAKERCGAILGSEHAKGRENLANHLAFNTDMPADQATAALQAAPTGAAAEPTPRLDALVKDPKVDPDTAKTEGPEADQKALGAAVDRMVAGMTGGR